MSTEYFKTLERLLDTSLEHARPHISAQDYRDIKEYIEHGEYGVGWELLWRLVNDKSLAVPAELLSCGNMMGFDISAK